MIMLSDNAPIWNGSDLSANFYTHLELGTSGYTTEPVTLHLYRKHGSGESCIQSCEEVSTLVALFITTGSLMFTYREIQTFRTALVLLETRV